MLLRRILLPPVLLILFLLLDLLITINVGWQGTVFTAILGGLLLTASVILALITVYQFRSSRTTLNPLYADMSALLITDGVFRYSRNPIYLAMVGVQLAWFLFSGIPLLILTLLVFIPLITVIHIRPEERQLSHRFPQQWPDYAQKVRRWL